jgi:o-succinylbenzoate synthase
VKIEHVDMRLVKLRLREPFSSSAGGLQDRECVIVAVTAEGLTGWGECAAWRTPSYSPETTGTAWHVLQEFLIPAILGHELEDVPSFVRCYDWVRGQAMARAALEMAAWDLLGQAQGRPLAAMLGAEKKRVEVGVAVSLQPSPESLVARTRLYLAEGYRRVKAKISPGRDVEYVEALRTAFPDLALQVDANGAYTLEDTPVFARLDRLGLLLIEQPLAGDDLLEHAALQARLATPIALDEGVQSVAGARAALELGACRAFCVKAARLGGLGEGLAFHNLAWQRGVAAFCGGLLETGIGRAAALALAALPGFTLPADLSASSRYYVEDLAEPSFVLNSDSTITLPSGPGLGVHVDPWRLERLTVAHESFGVGGVA